MGMELSNSAGRIAEQTQQGGEDLLLFTRVLVDILDERVDPLYHMVMTGDGRVFVDRMLGISLHLLRVLTWQQSLHISGDTHNSPARHAYGTANVAVDILGEIVVHLAIAVPSADQSRPISRAHGTYVDELGATMIGSPSLSLFIALVVSYHSRSTALSCSLEGCLLSL